MESKGVSFFATFLVFFYGESKSGFLQHFFSNFLAFPYGESGSKSRERAFAAEVKCREEQIVVDLLFFISEIFHRTFTIKRLTIDKIRNIMKSQIGEKLICKTKMNIRQNRREAVTQSQGTFFKKVRPVAIRIE